MGLIHEAEPFEEMEALHGAVDDIDRGMVEDYLLIFRKDGDWRCIASTSVDPLERAGLLARIQYMLLAEMDEVGDTPVM